MKNELNVFTSELFGSIRTVTVGDKPYFVAADIAKILGYARPGNAINTHCKGIVKHEMLTNGGIQSLNIIPKGDIYRLIARSKLPNAEKFEAWIFDEVLPSIRQNNKRIVMDEEGSTEEALAKGILAAHNIIKKRNQKISYLEKIIEEQKPLVAFAKRMMKTDDN